MSVEAEQVTEILATLREVRNQLALREDRRERKVHKADEKLAKGESNLRAWKRDQADEESEKAAKKDIRVAAKAMRDAQEFLAEYMHDRGYIDDDTAKMCNDISDAAFVLEWGENLNGTAPGEFASEEAKEAEGTVVIEGDVEVEETEEPEEAEEIEEAEEANEAEEATEAEEAAETKEAVITEGIEEAEKIGETEVAEEAEKAEEVEKANEAEEAEETEEAAETKEDEVTEEIEETEEIKEDEEDKKDDE